MQLMKIQSILLSLLLIVLFNGCSVLNKSVSQKENIQTIVNKAANSKLILLDVYHDRCETCKLIEPVFEQLEKDYSQSPDVVFLKYDLSNPVTYLRSRRIAKAIGVEEIYKAQRYSGIVLFIDSMTKMVLDSLIGEERIEKYNEIIENRLKERA